MPQGGGRDKMNAVCDTKLNGTDGNTRKCLMLLPLSSILNSENILDIILQLLNNFTEISYDINFIQSCLR